MQRQHDNANRTYAKHARVEQIQQQEAAEWCPNKRLLEPIPEDRELVFVPTRVKKTEVDEFLSHLSW